MAEKIKKCPLCKKVMDRDFSPFCSRKCKNIDLNRWLSDSYVIPGNEMISNDMPTDEEPEK